MNKSLESSIIIHSFAILHACACVFLLSRGGSDEAILTFLTIAMVILLCSQRKMSLSFTLASVVLSNLVGYTLGLAGAGIYSAIFSEHVLANVIATFVTTEIIGWLLYMFSNTMEKTSGDSPSHAFWLFGMMVVVFGARMVVMYEMREGFPSGTEVVEITGKFLSNSLAMLFLIGADVIIVRYILHKKRLFKHASIHILSGLLILLATVVIDSLLVIYNIPFRRVERVSAGQFMNYFLVGAVIEILIFIVVYIISYAVKSRAIAREEQIKAQQAQYRYLRLKQQVNPHFLFNNLNILDCLVNENRNEQASTYIRKLAAVYRYMLKYEDNSLVPLSEEMEFVEQYVDLLKVRFPEGMLVDIDIPAECRSKRVVPCSVQLLIENAIKHNIASTETPLSIKVICSADSITVTNNINPKASAARNSTGLGIKYIREQYESLSGRSLQIVREPQNGDYEVTLPLL